MRMQSPLRHDLGGEYAKPNLINDDTGACLWQMYFQNILGAYLFLFVDVVESRFTGLQRCLIYKS